MGGPCVRVVIATHPATEDPPKVGQQRNGVVYELFVSTVQAPVMTANDLLDLYLHCGSFETVLADEDEEQDPDRWCSQTSWGQEFWQILSQWVWNLRLECGQHCSATQLRTTVFASANEPAPASEPAEINHTQETVTPPRSRARQESVKQCGRATSSMALRNGLDHRIPEGLRDQHFLHKPMELCPAGRVLALVGVTEPLRHLHRQGR